MYGSFTTSRTTSRRRTISPQRNPQRLTEMQGAVPDRSQGEQGLSDRRGNLAADSSGRPRRDALQDLAVRSTTTTRMPEFAAPGLGRESNHVSIDAEFGENASGVLYALGGAGGGLTLYHGQGPARLRIQHDDHRADHRAQRSKTRRRQAQDRSRHDNRQAGRLRRKWCSRLMAPRSLGRRSNAPFRARSRRAKHSTSGVDLGSPVSLDYFDRQAFPPSTARSTA